ncbi:MAG: DUF4830 domain-containing protein [Oscillospiraceae bacterium]|nr:DUF4830 domain-containing protein [Oscillospiraceae bacterium]
MAGRRPRSGKVALLGMAFLILAGIWLLFRLAVRPNLGISGASNAERVEYIESFGWEAGKVPSEVKEIRIPARFDEAYEQYNAIQKEQGFDLRKYSACTAYKYTYRIKNYDGADPVVPINANLIVVDGKIVGADISSAEANGFVTVLAKK